MRHIRLLVTLCVSLLLQACASGPYISPEERQLQERAAWRTYYNDTERADALIRAGSLAEGAVIYKSYWRQGFDKQLPAGSPTPPVVTSSMEDLSRAFPGLRPFWQDLVPAAEARVVRDDVSPEDVRNFVSLVDVTRDPTPLVRQVDAIKSNERKIAVWRAERWVSDDAREILLRADRPDLAMVIERNPLHQVADAACDAASGIVGNIAAPILGPGMAGK